VRTGHQALGAPASLHFNPRRFNALIFLTFAGWFAEAINQMPLQSFRGRECSIGRLLQPEFAPGRKFKRS